MKKCFDRGDVVYLDFDPSLDMNKKGEGRH